MKETPASGRGVSAFDVAAGTVEPADRYGRVGLRPSVAASRLSAASYSPNFKGSMALS